ncbi:MAG TPA: ATP-binding protein [Puia sp.]|nr:ATP-binding protein [Puia sp.]
MVFELLLAIFIIRYLRNSLQTAVKLPKWDKILVVLFYSAILLFVLQVAVPYVRGVTTWVSHLLLVYLIYILYSQKEFRVARPVLLAVAPFILLSLFNDIAKLTDESRYKTWKDLLGVAMGFSVVWMVTMWVIINKQKKALEKEKVKASQEEEQKKQVLSLNDQLEIQVAERTAELTKQKEELQQTLVELKSAQSQLIQSEKMASLGELTAGIAHEIQNPLNFVNNFAEVNAELITEMEQEINSGNFEAVKELASDIKDNEEKISFHGKRADAIVKGMLQHSRKNTGQKELADINELADEYLRLSYHGLRAKDKSFNAAMKTNFDESLGKINIVPQDIGRVFLNIFNNAFYSVNEKKNQLGKGYFPTISVSTKRVNDKAQIKIRDNGNGIPKPIVDKIFQPFFTTKPTGQGTGLGLSLSYDIIKAHGGEIRINTRENEFTEFNIMLPA